MSSNTDFKLALDLRIDWSDLDTYGHVNNLSILRYLQSGRVQFWEISGFVASYKKQKIGHILVSTNCNFKQPLFYPGTVHVLTKVGYVKNSSFELCHRLYNEDGLLCAEATDIAVCYDFNTNSSLRIPEVIREKMKEL